MTRLDRRRYEGALHELENDLAARVERIDESIARQVGSPGDLSRQPIHNADRDAEGIDAEVAVGQHERDTLEEVRAALVRIEEGTYGVCEECDEPIGWERLEALPYARLCVECEERRNA